MNPIQLYQLNHLAKSISPSSFREIHDCVEFQKLIRQEIILKNIDRLSEAIENLNLNFSVSNQSFKIPIDEGMEFWASSLVDCANNEPNAMRLVYIHPDKNICDKAKLLDEKNDDLNLGLELKYPQCCIDAYCKWQTDNEDIDPITTITNSLPFTGELQFYNFPNPFSRYFGSGLYSHFPCSLTCKETKQIAKQSLDNLQIHFPFVADKLIQQENSFVIFQKEEGVCIWSRFDVNDNRIQLDKNRFQGQGKLKEIFSTVEEIELGENHLLLFSELHNQKIFKTDNCFIGAFNYLANAQKNTLLKTATRQPTNQSF